MSETQTMPANGPLGMTIFVISDALTFVALIVAFLLLRGEPQVDLAFPVLQTASLVGVSVGMVLAGRVRTRRRVMLALCMLCALAYLGLAMMEARALIAEGFVPASSLFAGGVYALVGFHAAHVVFGLGVLAVCVFRFKEDSVVRAGAIYWHFVDGLWLVLVVTVHVL